MQEAQRLTPALMERAAILRLEEFLPYKLTICASLVSAALSQIYAKRHKIGVPEWRILVTLGQFRSLTSRDIGSYSRMHKTKVSRAVAVLERRGWVTRQVNSQDRRETMLDLTPLGQSVYSELAPLALDFTRQLGDILDAEEQAIFDKALQKLSARAGELTTGLPICG